MTAIDIETVLHRRPFKPFQLRVDGADLLQVPHPDYFWMNIQKTVCFVSTDNGRVHIVDVDHISDIITT